MNIYNFSDYKEILQAFIRASSSTKGYKKNLARSAGCHPSYMSKVLRQECELIPEHAIGLAHFWGLDKYETEYFLNAVNLGRAGTKPLRVAIQSRMDSIRKERNRNETFVGIEQKTIQAAEYYRSWLVVAVHILCSIPQYQTPEAIAQKLTMPIPAIDSALATLISLNLVRKSAQNRYSIIKTLTHAPRTSEHGWQHLTNWRHQAISKLPYASADDVHFTNVMSLSRRDAKSTVDLLRKTLEQVNSTLQESPEEVCFALNLDFFSI